MFNFENLKTVTPCPLHHGTGISTVKMANKFENFSFYRAWMFNGLDWERLEDMSTTRDRPLCSLVQHEDGSVS